MLSNPCSLPSETALTKIVKAKMKMIRDALPIMMISFLTICCPTHAAIVATTTKYNAESKMQRHISFRKHRMVDFQKKKKMENPTKYEIKFPVIF